MFNSKIHNCNSILLEQQKQELIDEIISGQNKDYFKIFDIEAGCKKTRTAEMGIAQKIMQTNENVLFVRRTNADGKESAKIINKIVGKNVAFDFNNETVRRQDIKRIQNTFLDLRVLIITHQKYRELAKSKTQRNIFSNGRTTLIIDEFISDLRKLVLSLEDIENYKAFFKQDNIIYDLFLKIIYRLEDYYKPKDAQDRGFVIISIDNLSKNIASILRFIRNNFTSNTLKEYGLTIGGEAITTIKQLCFRIEDLKEFYFKPCYVRSEVFYTTDSRNKNWLLDNNILLDASGVLQIAYDMNKELYKVKNCQKVLDHSNWRLNNIIINTTTAGKGRIENFYDVVNATVKSMGVKETLVIGSQADMSFLKCNYAAYFGNITGSNQWASLKNVVIIQTCNLDDVDFILQFLNYSSDYVVSTFAKITTRSTGREMITKYSFTDPRFERIRCLWIAEQTYQALKRVNRSMEYATEAVIYMNNTDVIELLKTHLLGCEVITTSEKSFKYKKTKREEYIQELQNNSHAAQFKELIVELMNGKHQELLYTDKHGAKVAGTYAKKKIREFLHIAKPSNFSNRVLANTDVVEFCNTRGVTVSGQYIKLPM